MSNSRQSRSFLRSVERDERRMLKGKEETKGNETCYRIHCSVSEIESNDDSLYRLSLYFLYSSFSSFFPSIRRETDPLVRQKTCPDLCLSFLSLVSWHPPFAKCSKHLERTFR